MSAALNLLVVENGPDSRDRLCEILRLCGHMARAAATAEEGMMLLESNRFDVLFADVNLPGVSGIELAQTALQKDPDLKIVFASGFGFLVLDKTDFQFSLLLKPYGLEQVRYILGSVGPAVVTVVNN